ncbi:shikimate dehydrogenase family protein [Agrococcus sp. Ld7]|uniref:shikimate dehydrogenase family protein n=1 Tax=Agrococcus sp. Ld7 TaxID=649148 RepID=UPI00386F0304
MGSPIDHSLSPVLQGAAARELGLDWRCERRLVAAGELSDFVDVLDHAWLGLSVTAPLKEEARALAASVDDRAQRTGAVNTLLLGSRVRGFNTDVGGIVRAFTDAGVAAITTGAIAGAGATALSALLALAELGATSVTVGLRTAARGERLEELAAQLGVSLTLQPLDAALPAADAAVSTLPASAAVVPTFLSPPTRLLDADYARADGSRFASALPTACLIDGREMLLGQAVLQARIFSLGDVDAPLADEPRVVAAMRAAMRGAADVEAASARLEES